MLYYEEEPPKSRENEIIGTYCMYIYIMQAASLHCTHMNVVTSKSHLKFFFSKKEKRKLFQFFFSSLRLSFLFEI